MARTKEYELRLFDGNSRAEAVYSGAASQRKNAIQGALMWMRSTRPLLARASCGVFEKERGRWFPVISWTAMVAEDGQLEWVLEGASGMRPGESAENGIDWKAQRDRRLALGGEW